MIDPDSRAVARQHTAQLLKMLRGYGPAPAPSAPERTADPAPNAVAEASPAYVRVLDAPLLRTPPPMPDSTPPPVPPRRRADPLRPSAGERVGTRATPGFIPTVGYRLRHASGVLGRLVAQADEMNRLNHMFHAYLPPHLRDHAAIIRLDQEAWEVRADSASWATRLHYALPGIHPLLSQHLGITLPKPRIYVAPAPAPPPPPQRARLTLTRRNAELLEATARNLSDAQLSAALRRLAANARRTSEATEESSSRLTPNSPPV
ncbi:MAG: DUF721 domain-containing protein [Candidatus Competibacter sp.]|nr:DUF721 domain-containing protein [Candidatus Competibacter sp.]MDG4606060.1 DciA family protein [Candidatus Contendobacter sp.]HRD50652.1 DciA family protein [Candidatus Contendobacter sp.]